MSTTYLPLEFLAEFATILWKGWPIDMQVTILPPPQGHFSLRGTCPHCRQGSVFVICSSTSPNVPALHQIDSTIWAIMQCQGCLYFILGNVFRQNNGPWQYSKHYPLGSPNDDVAPEIPANISCDFREALRCRFVDAYNATVEMCRRAVEASCIGLKAPTGKKLVQQIDWLAEQAIITKPLQDMAHRIRLGGNLGAHPPEDPEDKTAIVISPEYADAVIEFTREFFQHVYVLPQRLDKFTFRKTPPAT